ncbi:GNAT family N-acetyltransferase [Pseudonocardia sp. KRD-182]|uniref:GNAT family N-acetyltransferase n=1 Tax=Pseudonocardia oceani TaxID=2792013 RepID=UPI001C49F2D6|nr:GNAT family N-acyltransferase [Pseudonocardia oceani]MBW0112971.1 GNAT family N-acetyltransferase [Pseudonocardia oceani]
MTASQLLAATPPAAASRYSLLLTTDAAEVRAAQRLRHRVFAGELGARLHSPEPGLDVDRFDAHCDHLVVREDATGEIVGTYRMLPPARARDAGGLYAEDEFALDALAPLRDSLVETGRSCVHPDHRDGAVINLVWAGIARYMLLTGHRWLIGCASVPLADGGALAASVAARVRDGHLSPPDRRVTPHRPWTHDGPAVRASLPPLLRGYLRLGAQVCGAPAHDPDFGCADFPVLLGLDHMDPRYARFFLGEGA